MPGQTTIQPLQPGSLSDRLSFPADTCTGHRTLTMELAEHVGS